MTHTKFIFNDDYGLKIAYDKNNNHLIQKLPYGTKVYIARKYNKIKDKYLKYHSDADILFQQFELY